MEEGGPYHNYWRPQYEGGNLTTREGERHAKAGVEVGMMRLRAQKHQVASNHGSRARGMDGFSPRASRRDQPR